jgi:NAD(P)-dependent dehydrogenase (short-subunit alcohol dehydrogenase family)
MKKMLIQVVDHNDVDADTVENCHQVEPDLGLKSALKGVMMRTYPDFTGKVAVVTGGRRGLGRAMALSLAEHGAKVAVISQSSEADELMKEIKKFGSEGLYIQANLGKREERIGRIDGIVNHFGRIDILVNNAGLQFVENIESCTQQQWDISRNILLDAVFELSQQAIPYMKNQGGGKIINIASICAFREGGWNFSYGVMKGAIVSMTRCMANSLAQHKINVNAIAPGIIRTDLTEECFTDPIRYESQIQKYPARRLGEPEDIVGPMLFLASDLSRFVHGQTLIVDGGFTGN